MKTNELDRRTLKTKHAIQEALFSLMLKKQYSRITIQNIIDKANVGRSTFYSHYNTKDELLLACIDPMLDMIKINIGKYIESGGTSSQSVSVLELFEHVKQNSRVINGLLKAENPNLFFNRVVMHCDNQAQQYLSSKIKTGNTIKIPIPILTHHISITLTGLVKWWLNNNMPYTPEQMNQYFHGLINPFLNTLIKNNVITAK